MVDKQFSMRNLREFLDNENELNTPEMCYTYLLEEEDDDFSIEEFRKKHDEKMLKIIKSASTLSLSMMFLYVSLKTKIIMSFIAGIVTHTYTVLFITAVAFGFGVGWNFYYNHVPHDHRTPVLIEGTPVTPVKPAPDTPPIVSRPAPDVSSPSPDEDESIPASGKASDPNGSTDPTLTIHRN